MKLLHYETLDSTNSELNRLARGGAEEWTVVTANTQTAGRGRRGRAWHSPDHGNLYMSVLLRPAVPIADLPALAPVAGLAVADALGGDVKWPNDVELAGRKVAGILTESIVSGEQATVIIGIGVNVNIERFPEDLDATSLRIEGRVTSVEEVRDAVVSQLRIRVEQFVSGGFAALREDWNARHALAGQPVRVDTGSEIVEGIARGVDDRGALIVGERTLWVGEVL